MKIYIDKSKTHGKGLFAAKDIKKGEIVFITKGKRINFLISNKEQAQKAGLNWFGFGKNQWLDVKNNYCDNLNHSCDPNVGIKGKVVMVALRNIKKGEEITLDYSANEADIFWSFRCNCGSKNCRKIIKSIQFLPINYFNKYKLYIPKYYKSVFNKFNLSNFKDNKELIKKWVNFIKAEY